MILSFHRTAFLLALSIFGSSQCVFGYAGYEAFHSGNNVVPVSIVKTPTDGGIREEIPAKYREKYEKWKAELLSTEIGRDQWNKYALNKRFVLTIRISKDKGMGAGTDKFEWDDNGNFVGARITLGNELDEGFPNPIYYPVLNSLSEGRDLHMISGKILAATKLSHELGHVNQTAAASEKVLETQNRLIPVYTSIFLSNGRNVQDAKLLELERKIGGTPIEIWESREYWSEVNAMFFLKERIKKEAFYCDVFNRIRRNIDTYAKAYLSRFDPGSDVANSPCWRPS